MTLSVVARCPDTGRLGVIITSSSPAVAARCARVRAGVGAASSQNITDPRLGPALLDALEAQLSAQEALDRVIAMAGPAIAYRQLVVVDAEGGAAVHSGEHTLGTYAAVAGQSVASAGNLLASTDVVAAAAEATEHATGHLAERLLAGLAAGLAAGGEAGPVRSAGLLIAGVDDWPETDLRVDWSDDPLGELQGLWRIWAPQADDYLARAHDPSAAPSFGVAGDP